MTLYQPQYRIQGFLPRSLQSALPAETDVLVPGAGAPHSDQFKVATIDPLAGYKPYMYIPTGRRGTFDPIRQEYEQGTLSIEFIDAKTSFGQEAQRWVTGFLDRLPTAKMFVEWRTDPTAAWDAYWTGRVSKVETSRLAVIGLTLGDMSVDLDYEIGARRPHPSASGIVTPTLLPYAVSAPYGTLKAYNDKGKLRGTLKTSGTHRYIELDARSAGRPDNVVSARLAARAKKSLNYLGVVFGSGNFANGLRLRFTAGALGITDKEVLPVKFGYAGADGPPRVFQIMFEAVTTGDPFYTAIDSGTLPDGTVVDFDVREDYSSTVFVSTTTVQHVKDVLDGYFGPRTEAGLAYRAVPKNAASFAALLGTADDIAFRGPLSKIRAPQWLQQPCLQVAKMGLRWNALGEAEIFSWARPTTLAGLVTIVDDDLADPYIEWREDPDGGVTDFKVTAYAEELIPPQKIAGRPDEFPDLPLGLLTEESDDIYEQIPTQWGSLDLKPKDLVLDAKGLRYMTGEGVGGVGKADWVRQIAAQLSALYSPLYGFRGPQYLAFRCKRTTGPVSLKPGNWCLLSCAWIPNTGSLIRGGSRLVLITRISEDKNGLNFEVLDAGPGAIANAPTIGAPAQEAGNTKYGFTLPVTLNAQGEPVGVWVNYTSTGVGARPAANDPGWMYCFPQANVGQLMDPRVRTTATHTFRLNAPGKRCWLRADTEPLSTNGTGKLPSAFVFPSTGPGYVDLDPIATPSAVATSSITAKGARVSWTPGDTTIPVVVLLGSGASQVAADASTPVVVSPILPPGTTRFDLTGLDLAGPWYRPQVAHLDKWGQPGAVAGTTPTSFQATGAAPKAPTPAGLSISRGGSTSGPIPSVGGGLQFVGRVGIELKFVPGPAGLGYDLKIYRAVETAVGAGTYGAYTNIYTMPAELVQGREPAPWQDFLGNDGLKRRYKFTLIGPGTDESNDSIVVEDTPGWLPVVAYGTASGEAVLGQKETLVLGAGDFLPESDTGGAAGWVFGGAFMSPRSTLGSVNAYAPIPSRLLPVGAQILEVRARVRAQAGDALTLALRYYVDNAGTLVDTVTAGATGDFTITMSGSSVGHLVGAGRSYVLDLLMDAFATASDVGLYRVEIDFVRTSYRQ